MATQQISDKLLRFPLFQGMGHYELMQMVSPIKLEFVKLPEGKRLLKSGSPCNRLWLLTDGQMAVETAAPDGGYTVEEWVKAPAILQPECLFGLHQQFRSTFTTATDCNLIAISKAETAKLCAASMTFRLNLLNILATAAQNLLRSQWRPPGPTLEARIAHFIASRCLYPIGRKVVAIRMVRLADELNDSRLDVSRALNSMHQGGQLLLRRGRIIVPALETLGTQPPAAPPRNSP